MRDHCLTAVLALRPGEGVEGVALGIVEAALPIPRDVTLLFGLQQLLFLLAGAEGIQFLPVLLLGLLAVGARQLGFGFIPVRYRQNCIFFIEEQIGFAHKSLI